MSDVDVQRIFGHWRRVCGWEGAKLTPPRENAVQALLDEGYSSDLILRAIDGVAASDWWMRRGQHAGGDFPRNDLATICKSGHTVERLAQSTPRGRPAPVVDTRRLEDRSKVATLRGMLGAMCETSEWLAYVGHLDLRGYGTHGELLVGCGDTVRDSQHAPRWRNRFAQIVDDHLDVRAHLIGDEEMEQAA